MLALAGCQPAPVARVEARQYSAFYLWPGVRPPEGAAAQTLYLLDGEIRRGGAPHLTRLRAGLPHLPGREVWLVVRANRLDWNESVYADVLADMARWEAAGTPLAGLQIDFDASTHGLDNYARFLAGVRGRLPSHWRLSITGLMDWSAHGDPAALADLKGVVDEVVVQTYQARRTIPGYASYFARMGGFPIPFRVALADGGAWQAPPQLAHHPRFKGYVVFVWRAK